MTSANKYRTVCLWLFVNGYLRRGNKTSLQKERSTEKPLCEGSVHHFLIVDEHWEEGLAFPVLHWEGSTIKLLSRAKFVRSQKPSRVIREPIARTLLGPPSSSEDGSQDTIAGR
jgi:hypothetical protein